MKYYFLVLVFSVITLAWPASTWAENIPAMNAVVLLYQNEQETSKHNYLFTISGDDTIYPCAANQCDMAKWTAVTTVNMTIYVLPAGFNRVASMVDQLVLREYTQAAERTYQLNNFNIVGSSTGGGRAYQTVALQADGSYQISANNYVKPDVKEQRNTNKITTEDSASFSVQQVAALIGGVLLVLAVGVGLWRFYKYWRLRY
ncbi:MAG: hypothetical protein WCW27_03035 [Patescibacteria group bacterium]|jgi:hypothetical protein